MTNLTPRVIWRGNPISADHQPDPKEIVAFLEVLQLQAQGIGAMHFEETLDRLTLVVGATEGDVGFVLFDDNPSASGVYRYEAGVWAPKAALPRGMAYRNIDDTADADKPLGDNARLAFDALVASVAGHADLLSGLADDVAQLGAQQPSAIAIAAAANAKENADRAQVAAAAAGSPNPFVIVAAGQSNFAIDRDYAWVPPSNLKVWDYDKSELGTGTQFDPADATKIGAATAFAAHFAKNHPLLQVHLVTVASPNMPIDHWIGGLNYTWDNTANANEPALGTLKLNTGNDSLTTTIRINRYDREGVNRVEAIERADLDTCAFIRIEKVGDPAVYAEYVPVSGSMVETNDQFEISVSNADTSNSLQAGDDVKVLIGPDAMAALKRNIGPALVSAGVTRPEVFLWWQGESNKLHPDTYLSDFELMRTDLVASDFLAPDTPIVVFGIGDESITGSNSATRFNTVQQRLVTSDVQNRMFVNTSKVPFANWSSNHLDAEGYEIAGRMAASGFMYGGGYRTVRGLSVDTVTGQVLMEAGNAGAPALAFADDYYDFTGLWRAGDRAVGFNGSLKATMRAGFSADHVFEADNSLSVTYGRAGNSASGPQVAFQKARGTLAAPSLVVAGDSLGQFPFRGYDGATFRLGGLINLLVKPGAIGPTSFPTKLLFRLGREGSGTLADAFELDYDEGLSFRGSQFIDGDRMLIKRNYTVSGLPPAGSAGRTAMVSDASSPAAFDVVVGGGAATVPVYDDGTDWRVG